MKKVLLLFTVIASLAFTETKAQGIPARGTLYFLGSGAPTTLPLNFRINTDIYRDTTYHLDYTWRGGTLRVSPGSTGPYKQYCAYITQTSTGYPQATVISNNLSDTIAWVRTSAGVYTGTLSGAFTSTKVPSFTKLISTVDKQFITGARTGANTFVITTDTLGGSGVDVGFSDVFEIKVYY